VRCAYRPSELARASLDPTSLPARACTRRVTAPRARKSLRGRRGLARVLLYWSRDKPASRARPELL
jgi:hypothetical protein